VRLCVEEVLYQLKPVTNRLYRGFGWVLSGIPDKPGWPGCSIT
jgi:hypothetical protein